MRCASRQERQQKAVWTLSGNEPSGAAAGHVGLRDGQQSVPEAVPSVGSWDQSARDHRMWGVPWKRALSWGCVFTSLTSRPFRKCERL